MCTMVVMMKFAVLLAKIHIAPNLLTPSPYKSFHFVLDGGCDDGVDPAADRCAPYSKSRDTVPCVGLILCPIDGCCDDGVDHAAGRCAPCSKSLDTAPLMDLTSCPRRWL
jgi:hypothetical protein